MGGGIDGETSPFGSLYDTYVFVGRMFAFAMVSGRTIDLPLSTPLRKAILEGDGSLDPNSSSSAFSSSAFSSNVVDKTSVEKALAILKDIDPAMCRHLSAFQNIAVAHSETLQKNHRSSTPNNTLDTKDAHLDPPHIDPHHPSMCFQGAPIDMLCLDFTLPGDSAFELMPDGANVAVELSNLGEYVRRVCQCMVLEPLQWMATGIRQGMSSMFDPHHLRCFDADELELLLCGTPATWTVQELHEHIQTDHGYSKDSIAVQQLLSILGSFDAVQQREFLKFVTGSPRLPVGGLGALRPRLTVVRKGNNGGGGGSSGGSGGGSLPSASTCTSYLKLPEYENVNVMREKLLLAIKEGGGSFHLS